MNLLAEFKLEVISGNTADSAATASGEHTQIADFSLEYQGKRETYSIHYTSEGTLDYLECPNDPTWERTVTWTPGAVVVAMCHVAGKYSEEMNDPTKRISQLLGIHNNMVFSECTKLIDQAVSEFIELTTKPELNSITSDLDGHTVMRRVRKLSSRISEDLEL